MDKQCSRQREKQGSVRVPGVPQEQWVVSIPEVKRARTGGEEDRHRVEGKITQVLQAPMTTCTVSGFFN